MIHSLELAHSHELMYFFIFQIYKAMESENFKDLKVASLDRVNITLPGDGYHPDITGCTFMQNGNVVLCDYSNSCIKILSDTFTIKDCLQLNSQPWDVSPVNNNSVVITVPEKRKIQFIQMVPKTKLGHSIKLDTSCWGVQVVKGLIYVTSRADKGTREVLVLDMKGHVKERFERSTWNSPMFTSPGYITVCSSSSKMFVTKYGADTISCLKTNGNVVYQYYNQELRDPRGICVDGGENIIICGLESNNVQVIRVDGTKRYTLLTSQDGVSNPRSIAHRQSDNTLILGCWNKENLSVYKVK